MTTSAIKVLEYISGFSVGPTATDFAYASMYASDVIAKELCESRPDTYTWVPSTVTRYPCPEGLSCSTGTCKFKKEACVAMSELPYYDCTRRQVACNTTPSGVCEICDYSISAGHTVHGPFIRDSGAPSTCYAGDEKYAAMEPYPLPLEAPLPERTDCDSDSDCQQNARCGVDENDLVAFGRCLVPCTTPGDCAPFDPAATCGTPSDGNSLQGRCFVPQTVAEPVVCPALPYDPPPYSVLQYDTTNDATAELKIKYAPVPCQTDEQCIISPGVGGVCGRDPRAAAYGFCYDPSMPPYLEWRDELKMWTDLPPSRNVCIQTLPYMRQWCEMPWTRAGKNPDNPQIPLSMRVKNAWKSKARPPFWYNDLDGSCHVTKTYCDANLKNGGFSAGYGNSVDYWLGNSCTGSTDLEVRDGYDCCTMVGDSVGQFFLGRTFTTDFRELVTGDADGFETRWKAYMERADAANLRKVVDFISDPRLKDNLRRWAPAVLGRAVHAYTWTWNATAMHLYGLAGHAYGLLSTEVAIDYSRNVRRDQHGYDHVVVDTTNPQDATLLSVLRLLNAEPWLAPGAEPTPKPNGKNDHAREY